MSGYVITFVGGPMAGRTTESEEPKKVLEIPVSEPLTDIVMDRGAQRPPVNTGRIHIYKLVGLQYVHQGERLNG